MRFIRSLPGLAYALLLTLILLFPFAWLVSTSFKGIQLLTDPYSFIPREPTLGAYRALLSDPFLQFGEAFRNTLLSVSATLVLGLPIGVMGGYALARIKGRWVDAALISLFFLRMMPTFVTAAPQFRLLLALGLVGSPLGLYLLYAAMSLPLTMLTVRNYLLNLPIEIEEAAAMDGCSRFQIFRHIAVPLSRPAIMASGLFIFVNYWLEYILVAQLMRGKYLTLSILLVEIAEPTMGRFDLIFSLAVLISLPIIAAFPLIARYLTSGAFAGSVKG
jgi:ABC-type glycerol-3-phosphate transport system permease component